MVTKEEALTADVFHYNGKMVCFSTVGKRGGVKTVQTVCRRNGATQTWKRDVKRFRVPVKYGIYEYNAITQDNAADWHTEANCPLNQH